jgi:SAM-dependent methyltransferase
VGCDIHQPTITWMKANYPATVRLYANNEMPPLPEADDTFDLIYCGSVFSHLTNWAPWLLELRRILKPGGALVASIHGEGYWNMGVHGARGMPWDEDNTGLLVEHYGTSFADSWGPAVYVSEWWVREHWGRALNIDRFEPTGFGINDTTSGQAWLIARKPLAGQPLAPSDIETPASDPREATAALRGQQLAYEELEQITDYTRSLQWQVADLNRRLSTVENSKSWNFTRPLRSIAQRIRSATR